MTGNELPRIIADRVSISRPSAKTVVDQVLRAIAEAAARGEDVSITGFGNFKVKAGRPGESATRARAQCWTLQHRER